MREGGREGGKEGSARRHPEGGIERANDADVRPDAAGGGAGVTHTRAHAGVHTQRRGRPPAPRQALRTLGSEHI